MRSRAILTLAAGLWLAALGRDGVDGWIDGTRLPALTVATGVEVLARDDTLLRAYTVEDGRWRLAVSPVQVDPDYLDMLVVYEDKRFLDHAGVDPIALARAGVQALRAGRVVSGGSTLTMQVARLLEGSGTGAVRGKLRQMRVALALERRLSKSEILTLYRHLAPFGGNVEGVRAASLTWFGKEPRRLTEAEAALLVALPQAPEARRPDRAPERARAARDAVLVRMQAAGLIDARRIDVARTEPIPLTKRDFPAFAPHLSDRLRAADPRWQTHRTTIDARLQAALERLARGAVADRERRLSAAILVADHGTGEILASVGAAGWGDAERQGFVDMTQALRSPGSTLKPLVYALAFDDGLAHPETLIEDRPTAFGSYRPQNFDRQFRGTVRMREALQLSLNVPVVALTEALGPARLMVALQRAGVRAELPGGVPGLAVALGGVGVSLEGIVQLYSALGNGGTAVPLHVTGTGGAPVRVVGERAAWAVSDILASGQGLPGWPRVAWKTGTSYGHRDALAVGYDGRHVVGVWLGRADGTPVPGAFGADLALPVLAQAFGRLKPVPEPLRPPPEDALIVATAELPAPLQRFRAQTSSSDGPGIAFPPDGAEVEVEGGLLVRVQGGTGPFTWLADGRPIALQDVDREAFLEGVGPGFVTLSVIDSTGRSARAQVRLR